MTDYTKPSKYVVHLVPASSTCFAKLDATHGYFQFALTKEASDLIAFILPSGSYSYFQAPMGLSASSDESCRHSDQEVEGLPWTNKIVDDILIWTPNV